MITHPILEKQLILFLPEILMQKSFEVDVGHSGQEPFALQNEVLTHQIIRETSLDSVLLVPLLIRKGVSFFSSTLMAIDTDMKYLPGPRIHVLGISADRAVRGFDIKL